MQHAGRLHGRLHARKRAGRPTPFASYRTSRTCFLRILLFYVCMSCVLDVACAASNRSPRCIVPVNGGMPRMLACPAWCMHARRACSELSSPPGAHLFTVSCACTDMACLSTCRQPSWHAALCWHLTAVGLGSRHTAICLGSRYARHVRATACMTGQKARPLDAHNYMIAEQACSQGSRRRWQDKRRVRQLQKARLAFSCGTLPHWYCE